MSVELKQRTKSYALSVIRMLDRIPAGMCSRRLSDQLLRCATSVGANYRAACRAKSNADFIFKLTIVEEECDESLYWMELLTEAAIVDRSEVLTIMREGNEILAIVVASIRTAKKRTRA